ncbi:MAG: hypothetical protein KA143_09830, partial [Saprospiraceae bacterium]|nr:hypothetical protein [Saprospiraceae bacterium]
VITKDSKWISLLIDHGFAQGMVPKLEKPSLLNHQQIYSFLMTMWAVHDSLDYKIEILKDGLHLVNQ